MRPLDLSPLRGEMPLQGQRGGVAIAHDTSRHAKPPHPALRATFSPAGRRDGCSLARGAAMGYPPDTAKERGAAMSGLLGKNLLCFGDNLEFLSDHDLFPAECVDLIYLDPPFNSQQSYNVLFKETTGTPAAAQIKAFEDTWHWDMAANEALTRIHQDPAVPPALVELMKTFMNFLKPSPMMAYLVQMAIRLVHMHRILKPTGSLYLHCDPTASHYLKIILDAVFGPTASVNEVIWRRYGTHNDVGQGSKHFGRVHDTLLFYSKSQDRTWNQVFVPLSPEYVEKTYRLKEPSTGRLYTTTPLTGPGGAEKGNPVFEWKGHTRAWRYSKETMEKLDAEGRLHYSKTGYARKKLYLDESRGVPVQDIWDDVKSLSGAFAERLGYPTQKPLELLKRIVAASSNPGDVVMDPFCGCGTTIDAVETLNRENPKDPPRTWIGIDVTHLSINLIKHRLTRFEPLPVYEVLGEPTNASGAEALFQHDPYQFQFWALGLIGARPMGGKKKGADKGIDGVRYILDEKKKGVWVSKTMLVQVKGGKTGVKDIRGLVGTLSREGAEMGVFLTLQPPTKPMVAEAASAGMYDSPWDQKPHPRVQILTVEDLLADPYRPNPRCLDVPGGTTGHTLPDAPRHRTAGPEQKGLFEGE